MLENLRIMLCCIAQKMIDYAPQMPLLCSLNYQQNSFPAETVITLPENSVPHSCLSDHVEGVGFGSVSCGSSTLTFRQHRGSKLAK